MWELDHKESWDERNDVFELWIWRRLLRIPWTKKRSNQSILKDFPGKNSGVGCHFLLQEIFPSLGLNLGLLHSRQTLYHLNHQGSSKGNQSWLFIGRIDAEAETPILWPPDAKSWLIWKDADAGKDWRQEKKGITEDEMVRRHHWLNGHEFEQAPRDSEGQGSLACCSPWSC